MYKIHAEPYKKNVYTLNIIVDTDAEVGDLPISTDKKGLSKCAGMGSSAFVIESQQWYVLDSNDVWVPTEGPGFGGGGTGGGGGKIQFCWNDVTGMTGFNWNE
jgi:hypothetical protein